MPAAVLDARAEGILRLQGSEAHLGVDIGIGEPFDGGKRLAGTQRGEEADTLEAALGIAASEPLLATLGEVAAAQLDARSAPTDFPGGRRGGPRRRRSGRS